MLVILCSIQPPALWTTNIHYCKCMIYAEPTRSWQVSGVITHNYLIADNAQGRESSTWPLCATFLITISAICGLSPVTVFCSFALVVVQRFLLRVHLPQVITYPTHCAFLTRLDLSGIMLLRVGCVVLHDRWLACPVCSSFPTSHGLSICR